MLNEKKSWKTGNTTLEYSILLPVVFACVFAVIIVFLVLYQKALIQNLAEDVVESLSKQWGYLSISDKEMETGIYEMETYKDREIYWNLKIWNNRKKEDAAVKYIKSKLERIGPLKPSKPNILVSVKYSVGFPSTLSVDIKAAYRVPGAGLMRLIGMGNLITIQGRAQALVYDAKDMINSTDFCLQILQQTETYQNFIEKIAPIKEHLEELLNK